MLKKLLSIAVSFYLALISSHAAACAGHLYLNPDNFGVMGNLAIKLAGLAPPEPIFKLKHPPLAKATLGEESEITVDMSVLGSLGMCICNSKVVAASH